MSKSSGRSEVLAAGAGDMALPRDILPSVQFMSSKEFFEKYQDRSKTPSGLFILDADFIPRAMPDILKQAGLSLDANGVLTNVKGAKSTALLWHHLVSPSQKQGMLVPKSQQNRSNGWQWQDLFVTPARAASPYPLAWVSAWGLKVAETGFCRTVYADVGADSWGPLMGGDRPHTRIEYIETRVVMANCRRNSCSNCDTSRSHDEWFVGCFWPAYATSGYFYANLKDRAFTWTWRWRW